jgi:hypothetical protein
VDELAAAADSMATASAIAAAAASCEAHEALSTVSCVSSANSDGSSKLEAENHGLWEENRQLAAELAALRLQVSVSLSPATPTLHLDKRAVGARQPCVHSSDCPSSHLLPSVNAGSRCAHHYYVWLPKKGPSVLLTKHNRTNCIHFIPVVQPWVRIARRFCTRRYASWVGWSCVAS